MSGGQTGADRAALDFAISKKIPHGGWCPKGRWAEDGRIHLRYRLKQTPRKDPAQRTAWNVRDSDGTVIFSLGRQVAGGAVFTAELAAKYRKPCIHLHRTNTATRIDTKDVGQKENSQDPKTTRAGRLLARFLEKWGIRVLNVAGPRESEEPGIGDFVKETLARVFG